jgi:hypothetical protein
MSKDESVGLKKMLGDRQNLARFTLMPTQQGFAFACECNRFTL